MLESDIRIDDDMLSRCPECRLGWLCYEAQPRESGEAVWSRFALLLQKKLYKVDLFPVSDRQCI